MVYFDPPSGPAQRGGFTYWVNIGVNIGVILGYIGIMEKKMEATIYIIHVFHTMCSQTHSHTP